jgi:hypothetical protein
VEEEVEEVIKAVSEARRVSFGSRHGNLERKIWRGGSRGEMKWKVGENTEYIPYQYYTTTFISQSIFIHTLYIHTYILTILPYIYYICIYIPI